MSVLSRPFPRRLTTRLNTRLTTLLPGFLLATALLLCTSTAAAQDAGPDSGQPDRATILSELDAFWTDVSRSVGEGDFDGYAATYHEDAVLVSGSGSRSGGVSYPISSAFAGWKPDFERTRANNVSAGVSFRFTERLVSATTAHERGLFRYRMDAPNSDPVDAIVHFEALLVKKNGRWLTLMEYQQQAGTEEEWIRSAAGE